MQKEHKIITKYLIWFLVGLMIMFYGMINTKAATYDSSQFEARLYDNYGTSLQYVTTDLIYGWQGNIPHMVANSTGGAWGIQSPIALLKDHTYSITIEIGGTWGGSLILSSKNRVGVGRNYDDAIYSYVNGTNAELKYSKATNGYTLQYAVTAKGDSSYLIIPFATSASGGPWEFRLQNIIIDDLGQDGVTEEEINNSFNNQTNIINNTINNMGEEIKDSIKDTFESCEMSPNLFNYNSYTFDKVVLNAYYFIDLGTFKPNTYYTIYNYNQTGLNPNYSYTFMSVLPNYSGITFTNLAEFASSTIRTDNTGKLYIGVYSETIQSFTQNDWNNFMSNFQQAMLVEGTNTGKEYQPYGEEKCQNKIDQTNDKLDQAETTRKGIWDTIKNLPNAFMDMLKNLFIPEDDYFEDWFNTIKIFFEEKLGFLATPFTIIIDFVNKYLSLNPQEDIIINIPNITVPNFDDYIIIEATTFNWSELLESKESLNMLWQLYLSFIDVFLILNFINLCESKYNRIFGGDTAQYEYYTVEDSYNVDINTGEVKNMRRNERKTTRKKVN